MEATRYERREKHTGKEVTDPAHGQLEQASRQNARLRQKERERRREKGNAYHKVTRYMHHPTGARWRGRRTREK